MADISATPEPVSEGSDFRSGASQNTIWILVIALAALIAYGTSLSAGFVWDDDYIVTRNQAIRSLSGTPDFFTDANTMASISDFRFYRPIRTLSFAIDYHIGGIAPSQYHRSNLLLHVLTSLLLFALLQSLAVGRSLSAMCALVFALHPGLSEAVFWVKGRADLLCSVFYLSAFIIYIRGGQRPGVKTVAGTLVALLLALFSKELAVSFILMIVAHDLICDHRITRSRVFIYAGTLVTTCGYLLLRSVVLQGIETASAPGRSLVDLLGATCNGMWIYTRLVVTPFWHNIDYLALGDQWTYRGAALGAIVVLVVIVMGLRAYLRGSRLTAFGLCWFFVALSPMIAKNFTSQIPTTQLVAERFLYLPMIGLMFALGGAFRRLGGPRVILPIIAVLFGFLTAVRGRDWESEESIFRANLASRPFSARVLNNLADHYISTGRHAEALELLHAYSAHLERPSAIKGLALFLNGRNEEGLQFADEVIRRSPDAARGYAYKGIMLGMTGRHQEAITFLNTALRKKPDARIASSVHSNLGIAHRSLGDSEAARVHFEKAVEVYPSNSEALINLGALYWREERWGRAMEVYRSLMEIQPNNEAWGRYFHAASLKAEG